MKNFIRTINANKVVIIRRTLIASAGIVAVTLVAGLIKIGPTEKAAEAVEKAARAVKKAADNA